MQDAIRQFYLPCYLFRRPVTGKLLARLDKNGDENHELVAVLPPLYPEWLGGADFCRAHHVRYPYIVGEMAQGIASVELVCASVAAGVMAVYGAGGLAQEQVEAGISSLVQRLGVDAPWAVNLIHSPQESYLEAATVDLCLRYGVRCVSASAFMKLEKSVVRYFCHGLVQTPQGEVERHHRVIAKVSRAEVAKAFLSPPPESMLNELLEEGAISAEQARLASTLPLAEDITAEADSGGHTDNRSLTALLPEIMAVRNECQQQFQYNRTIRVGAAGGLGTPGAVAAAFQMGAAYVVTGSINQAALEADQSALVKQMLAEQGMVDVIMAPAADMFELGVELQVSKRGTLFAQRAHQLYQIYRQYEGLEAIPLALREKIQREIFGADMDLIWQQTEAFWQRRHPPQLERAQSDPKHKMALLFRWYLGKSSQWAREGEAARRLDFQIWSGPAMGAFNRWSQGSFLAEAKNRTVEQISYNMLAGAAAITRAQQLRTFGVEVPDEAFDYRPRFLALGDES